MKMVTMALWGSLIMAGALPAQQTKTPALLVRGDDGSLTPLRVFEAGVEVSVVGNIAETLVTLRFRNDTDRVLEGELVFPLGEGRTVSRFALEVNGRMREGVSVPKNKGRAAFDAIVRSQIDPGLLEWTRGNNFRTRIYPIPANGFKAVQIGYEEELPEGDGPYRYRLPLVFPDPLGKFSLQVKAARRVEGPENAIRAVGGLELQGQAGESWVLKAEETQFALKTPLELEIPGAASAEPVVVTQKRGGEHFFYVLDRPELPAEGQDRVKPQSLHLVWDASHSGRERDLAKEMALLERYFQWVGNGTVSLSLLRDAISEGGRFEIKNGAWEELRQALQAVRYDGATQLGLLNDLEVEADAILLVSDGIATLGERLERKQRGVPLFVLHASTSAEHGLLRTATAATGGAYVNLLERSLERGLRDLTTDPYRLLSAEVGGGREIFPVAGHPVTGSLGLAGKLTEGEAVVLTLRYGRNGQVEDERQIKIDPGEVAAKSERAARLWAQKKLEHLESDAERNRDAIVALAQEHGLVTRFTSLIVLDRIEDYVFHRIVPPEPELRAEYERLLREAPPQEPEGPDPAHLARLLERWQERRDWHRREFGSEAALALRRSEFLRPWTEGLHEALSVVDDLENEQLREKVDKLTPLLGQFDDGWKKLDELRAVDPAERDVAWREAHQRLADAMDDLLEQAKELSAGSGEEPALRGFSLAGYFTAEEARMLMEGRGEDAGPGEEGLRQIRRNLYTAEGFKNLGRFDDAIQSYHQVLRLDPFNTAARRGLEQIHRLKSDYYRAAYDETRARLLVEVDSGWESDTPLLVGSAFGAGGDVDDQLFVGGGTAGGAGGSEDFISPVAFASIPGIPEGETPQVFSIVTAGLRSGDSAITRNSIDAILNNPDRSVDLDEVDPFGGDGASLALGGRPDPSGGEAPQFAEPGSLTGERPYLKALEDAAEGADLEAIYHEWKEKDSWGTKVGFYLDTEEFFRNRGDSRLADRVLSTIAELEAESVPHLRIWAHRCAQLGQFEKAEGVLREVLSLREDEPQSHRDLALVAAELGRDQEALDLMWEVVAGTWDSRFADVQMIVLMELNALVARSSQSLDLSRVDSRFLANLACDLRIVMTWSNDNTDADLYVVGPEGEVCSYQNQRTQSGARLTRDVTMGYGPEEYLIRKTFLGDYRIGAKLHSDSRQTLESGVTVQVDIFRNWGRVDQKRERRTLRLGDSGQVVAIGTVSFEAAGTE